MNNNTKTKSHFFSFCSIILLVLIGLTGIGRLMNQFYGIASTDILYDDWVSILLGYLLELLSCFRYVLGFGAVVYAQWKWGNKAGDCVFVTVLLCSLLDGGARFAIDYFTDSIRGMELMTLIWLLLQFVYEALTLFLCWITAREIYTRRQTSDSARRERKYSLMRAYRQSLLYVLILRLIIWAADAADFMISYQDIQSYEYASMVGQFIFTLVFYGLAAFLFSELVQGCFSRLFGKD